MLRSAFPEKRHDTSPKAKLPLKGEHPSDFLFFFFLPSSPTPERSITGVFSLFPPPLMLVYCGSKKGGTVRNREKKQMASFAQLYTSRRTRSVIIRRGV